jgi:SAM-dependent methyltransferase
MTQWSRGEAYEQYIGRWSRQVAPRFLSWLGARRDLDWLDVGTGTGALATAIADNCAPSSITCVEPSPDFRRHAAEVLGGRARVLEGNANAIPLSDASVDVVVSGLVLNFVPDQPGALATMKRVTRPGGTIAAYVWDYADGMQLIRHFWDAAAALDTSAQKLDEGYLFPLCSGEALKRLFADGGLQRISVTAIDIPTPFPSFDDCWQPFLGGQGPAPSYVSGLDESARVALRERFRAALPVAANGTIALSARAWAVRGVVGEPGATPSP